jgi:hypothetical protein
MIDLPWSQISSAIAAQQGGSFVPGSAQLADVVGNHTACRSTSRHASNA